MHKIFTTLLRRAEPKAAPSASPWLQLRTAHQNMCKYAPTCRPPTLRRVNTAAETSKSRPVSCRRSSRRLPGALVFRPGRLLDAYRGVGHGLPELPVELGFLGVLHGVLQVPVPFHRLLLHLPTRVTQLFLLAEGTKNKGKGTQSNERLRHMYIGVSSNARSNKRWPVYSHRVCETGGW